MFDIKLQFQRLLPWNLRCWVQNYFYLWILLSLNQTTTSAWTIAKDCQISLAFHFKTASYIYLLNKLSLLGIQNPPGNVWESKKERGLRMWLLVNCIFSVLLVKHEGKSVLYTYITLYLYECQVTHPKVTFFVLLQVRTGYYKY